MVSITRDHPVRRDVIAVGGVCATVQRRLADRHEQRRHGEPAGEVRPRDPPEHTTVRPAPVPLRSHLRIEEHVPRGERRRTGHHPSGAARRRQQRTARPRVREPPSPSTRAARAREPRRPEAGVHPCTDSGRMASRFEHRSPRPPTSRRASPRPPPCRDADRAHGHRLRAYARRRRPRSRRSAPRRHLPPRRPRGREHHADGSDCGGRPLEPSNRRLEGGHAIENPSR